MERARLFFGRLVCQHQAERDHYQPATASTQQLLERAAGRIQGGPRPFSFFRGCGIGQLSRRKKEEVELQNELFVEGQCRSDRPGFAIVDPDDHQVFKLYNAMGLGHQHDDLRTLLARVRSAQLAVQWCRFLSQESPFKFRASQVKGDEEALNHWDWRGEVEKQNLASSPPLPSLSDWLLQNT